MSKEDTKLTGPEYELLYKLLCDIRKFKQLNEGRGTHRRRDRPITTKEIGLIDGGL